MLQVRFENGETFGPFVDVLVGSDWLDAKTSDGAIASLAVYSDEGHGWRLDIDARTSRGRSPERAGFFPSFIVEAFEMEG